jgi:peptidoglycan/xylan/chitin deacetylase (PgdA/CDA1 family)
MIRESLTRISTLPMRRFTSGGAILGFHSITTRERPGEGMAHVSLEAFKSCVGVARHLGELVRLGELIARHQEGRSTAGLIALTFDDAYAALAGEFKDFVSSERIPITVFVVTQAANVGATYWWDRIDDAFPRVAPDRWHAFEAACGLPEEYRRGQPRDHGPLRPLRQWVLAAYAGRWPSHLEPALQALETEAGHRTRHRSMTFGELTELARLPGVELGVHTVSHPVLPLLSDEGLHEEIAAAYADLRERFATVLPVLAVPFGLYDERTLRAAGAIGIKASLTMAGANLGREAPRHVLPRYCVTKGDTPARLGLRLLGVPELVRRRRARRALTLYPDLPSATT